jgi:hypothetical protein
VPGRRAANWRRDGSGTGSTRAVTVLEEHETAMGWHHRFQYACNALMAGRLDKAAEGFGRLPEPRDAAWALAREKVRRMLARAGTARTVTLLDHRDLRGWHCVLAGGVLGRLSPYGFGAGMTGRQAYARDSTGSCAAALQRLRLILGAADTSPELGTLLPGRSSQVTGTTAASVLGLPTADFDPGNPAANALVVAYNLTKTDPVAVAALRERAPGQDLFERATCWTDPPRVTAVVSGLPGQMVVRPWAGQLRRLEDGTAGEGPADDRPAGRGRRYRHRRHRTRAGPGRREHCGGPLRGPAPVRRRGHVRGCTRTRRRLARRRPGVRS